MLRELFLFFFLMSCAVIAYTDARYGMVYNRVTLPLAAAGLAYAVVEGRLGVSIVGAAVAGTALLGAVLVGGAGAGDFKMAVGLGLWLGYPQVVAVLFLGCLVGCAWGIWRLLRAHLLISWVKTFLAALYLLVFYGVWTGAGLGRLEDVPEGHLPPWAVPFGACLAVAAWTVALLDIPPVLAGIYSAAGAGTICACWFADRRFGIWKVANWES